MESIRNLAIIFCAVCVMSGGLRLFSGEQLQKSADYILALILLTSIIAAVMNADFSFNISSEDIVAEASVGEIAISEYQAEYITARLLEEKEIEYEKIVAKANKSEDGSIVISKITITGAKEGERAVAAVKELKLTSTVVLE